MNTLIKKLRSAKGESITETLVAVLIVSLSTAMLVTMVLAAGRINYKAKQLTDKFYEELTLAETKNSDDQAEIVFNFYGSGVANKQSEVDIYGSSDGLAAYRKSGGGA